MTTDFRSPRTWVGLAAGAALALGSAGAMAGSMNSTNGMNSSKDTMTPSTHAVAPADAGSHKSLKELQTAQVHTGYAADAKDLKGAKTHLRHAANCLVGPKSPDYKAAANDPCSGAGAIPDSTNPQRVALAKTALSQIDTGLQAKNLSGAKKAANQATDTLREAVQGANMDKD